MSTPSFEEYLGEMAAGVQDRGICQCCGREQAVRDRGNITHHGYTIKYGWFLGTCPGQKHKPLQHDKTETEKLIAEIQKEIPEIEARIAKLKSGKIKPLKVKTGRSSRVNGKFVPETIDWADASEYQKEQAVKSAIFAEERRIKAGKDTITYMQGLIQTFYGHELKRVEKVERKKMEVGSVVNIAGQKNVTITKIAGKVARGVSYTLNGEFLDHAYWLDPKTGMEHSYPLKLARWPK